MIWDQKAGYSADMSEADIVAMVGRAIRLYRTKHDPALTQAELARKAELSTDDRLSKIELGKASPSLEELVRIAKVLGIPVRLLMSGEQDETILGRLQRTIFLFSEARACAIGCDPTTWNRLLKDLEAAIERAKKT